MINQITISLKLDAGVYNDLNAEVYTSGEKRNRIINKAIKFYIEHLDNQRRIKMMEHN